MGVVKHTPYRKPLQSNALHKLRGLACRPRPVLRPTISDLLQVDLLEDVIISTCLKHKGAESIFSLLLSGELNDEDRLLLEDIFTRINGLERRLQVIHGNMWESLGVLENLEEYICTCVCPCIIIKLFINNVGFCEILENTWEYIEIHGNLLNLF